MLVGAKVRVFLKLTNDFCFFRLGMGYMGWERMGEDGRGWKRMEEDGRGGRGGGRTGEEGEGVRGDGWGLPAVFEEVALGA